MESDIDGSEILRCVDRWGRPIVLNTATWTLHILPDREPLLGNEATVRRTLVDSHFVQHDATHDDRENFCRFGTLPAPFDHPYLKVCVEFAEPDVRGNTTGRVVTAFPTREIKPTEQRKWP